MPVTKKKPSFLSYESPLSPLSARQFRIASWYVRRKELLRKIGIGALAIFACVTTVYGIAGWAHYLLIGYPEDEKMFGETLTTGPSIVRLRERYRPQGLQFGSIRIFPETAGRYSFVSFAQNPNKRHLVHISYHMIYQGGQTESYEAVLLPKQEQALTIFGHEMKAAPSDVRLVIDALRFEWLSPHDVFDPEVYIDERFQFDVSNVSFTRKSPVLDVATHRIAFDLTNASAYGYWDAQYVVEFLDQGHSVGFSPLFLREFKAGETRSVDLRSFADILQVSDVRVYPTMNPFDLNVFLKP